MNQPTEQFQTSECEIKMLNMTHLSELQSLYREHHTHMGQARTDFYEVLNDELLVSQYLNKDRSEKIIFGAFLGGQLCLSMGIHFWQSVPSCTFLRFASRKNAFVNTAIRKVFRELFMSSLQYVESIGYNRFYIASSVKHFEALAYMGATFKPFRERYTMAVEEIIQPGHPARFEAFNHMIACKTWDVPIVIRSGTLKSSERSNVLLQKALPAQRFWE